MRTKLNLCKRNLLLCAFAFLLGSFPGFAKSRQGPSSSLPDRPAAVTPQRSVGPAAAGSAATFIAHVKIDRSGQETIVRVEGNGRLNCQTERLNNPERLVLDCFGARLALAQRLIPGGLKPILRVRLGQFKSDVARVVMDLERSVPFTFRSDGNSVGIAFAAASENPKSDAVAAHIGNGQGKNAVRSQQTQTVRPTPALQPANRVSAMPRVQSSPQSSPALTTVTAPAAKVEPLENAFRDDMLAFRAQNRTLRSILEQIAHKAGVAIILAEDVGSERLSVEFQHYRLDEALRQILKGYDVFFFYGVEGEKNRPASLKSVWVYSASAGRKLKPVALDTWTASTAEFQGMLADADPDVRARAIETLIRRMGRQSADALQEALKDKDEKVRTRALNRALRSGVEIPQELLIDLALNDASMNVRYLALGAVPVDPTTRWVAERAVHDSNPEVSRVARDILRELDSVGTSPGPAAVNPPTPPKP